MKQVDFSQGNITKNIIKTTFPMLVAQILNLLYNIVDRVYIARLPGIGTAALGAVGLCFPVIILITAFTNLFGSGGAPLFAMARGRGDRERAERIQNLSFFLLVGSGICLTLIGELFGRQILTAFGASDTALIYSMPYLRIYLIGTVFSMIATGMNPFVNAQGFPTAGMLTVVVGAAANIALDPLFMFTFGLGVRGAAIATVLSQLLSAAFVVRFLTGPKSEYRIRLLRPSVAFRFRKDILDIISLGTASFVMQFTNSLVQMCCNRVLMDTGGDIYVSVMTIVSSVRSMCDTPILAIGDGTSPILSFNYGAGHYRRIRKTIWVMLTMMFVISGSMWILISLFPDFFISIFSTDVSIRTDAVRALHLYFFAFVFQSLQISGQTVFKALNKKRQAVFFSLLRKVVIVVPLTFLLPYAFHLGTDGVFIAEPVSNVLGGTICFVTMLATVLPELKRGEV